MKYFDQLLVCSLIATYNTWCTLISPILQDSLKVIDKAMVDSSVLGASVNTCFQFERNGFFSVDPDTTAEKVILLSLMHRLALGLT